MAADLVIWKCSYLKGNSVRKFLWWFSDFISVTSRGGRSKSSSDTAETKIQFTSPNVKHNVFTTLFPGHIGIFPSLIIEGTFSSTNHFLFKIVLRIPSGKTDFGDKRKPHYQTVKAPEISLFIFTWEFCRGFMTFLRVTLKAFDHVGHVSDIFGTIWPLKKILRLDFRKVPPETE